MSDVDEQQLLTKLRARDEAAFNQLVRLHQDRVFRLLLRMLGDRSEAEDVAQEVFVSIFKAIDRFRGDAQLSTWVYRVTMNHCRNRMKYLARRRRHASEPFEDGAAVGESAAASQHAPQRPVPPDRVLEGRQTRSLLEQGLAALEPEQRELIILREVEHLSYEDIVSVTGLPVGTVKSRIHRARAALREFVRRREGGRHP